MSKKRGERIGRSQRRPREPNSNFWSATVLTPSLSVGIIRSLGVTRSCTKRRIIERRWERGCVGCIILRLWRAKRSRRRRWLLVPGVGVWKFIVADKSAGRCDLGTLALHDEPNDESTDYTESGESSHNTSSNRTRMRTSSSTIRAFC